jgi:hypothetical protein
LGAVALAAGAIGVVPLIAALLRKPREDQLRAWREAELKNRLFQVEMGFRKAIDKDRFLRQHFYPLARLK